RCARRRVRSRSLRGAAPRGELRDDARARGTDRAVARGRIAAPGTAAPAQPGARRDRADRRDARPDPRAPAHAPRAARGRCRLPPPAVVVVQPGLPQPRAVRLEFAGEPAREADPARGGAPDRRLGRPSAAPRAGPALLRILPPGAAGRAADLRRGRAARRDARCDRAAARSANGGGEPPRSLQGRDLLLDLELPAWPARR